MINHYNCETILNKASVCFIFGFHLKNVSILFLKISYNLACMKLWKLKIVSFKMYVLKHHLQILRFIKMYNKILTAKAFTHNYVNTLGIL